MTPCRAWYAPIKAMVTINTPTALIEAEIQAESMKWKAVKVKTDPYQNILAFFKVKVFDLLAKCNKTRNTSKT